MRETHAATALPPNHRVGYPSRFERGGGSTQTFADTFHGQHHPVEYVVAEADDRDAFGCLIH